MGGSAIRGNASSRDGPFAGRAFSGGALRAEGLPARSGSRDGSCGDPLLD